MAHNTYRLLTIWSYSVSPIAQTPLSPELRQIESEVDNAFRSNPLVIENFAQAAWTLLAVAEDSFFVSWAHGQLNAVDQLSLYSLNVMFSLNHSLRWLYSACPPDGKINFLADEYSYKSAVDLLQMGSQYQYFDAAYRYATYGLIGLSVEGRTIRPTTQFKEHSEYEAYNLLVKQQGQSTVNSNMESLFTAVAKTTRIEGHRFTYRLNPRIVELAKQAFDAVLNEQFLLPETWAFSRYSLLEFRNVFLSLIALAAIHFCARTFAANTGIYAAGFLDAILIVKRDELLARVVRYSGVSAKQATEILADMTYGSNGIRKPDLALQPLVGLNSQLYGIAPTLWIVNSYERNYSVLLNKLPQEHRIYSRLVNEKEALLRVKIQETLKGKGFRFVSSKLPKKSGLPDIDLAVISDSDKVCLLFELKWFIEPAEVREIIERTKELKNGVDQLIQLKLSIAERYQPLLDRLGIDESYNLIPAVVSANWIGKFDAQHPDVPILNANHIINKITSSQSIYEVIDWIENRRYLPIKNEHYYTQSQTASLGQWSIEWYGLTPTLKDGVYPL